MSFGQTLRRWRVERRMSQLELSLTANVSARHISFLETGRARPSRSMVLQLCEELDVPRTERNRLLTEAGLAPAYARRDLDAVEMTPVREAVEWMLSRQDPYPAIALDRHWKVLRMNRTAGLLLAGMGLGPGDSLIGALCDNEAVRAAIENIEEVIDHSAARLRTEIAAFGGDEVLEGMLARLLAHRGPDAADPTAIRPAFIPTRYRMGGARFAFFSTFTQFGGAEDIALAELKIEMMFPADDATRAALEAMAA